MGVLTNYAWPSRSFKSHEKALKRLKAGCLIREHSNCCAWAGIKKWPVRMYREKTQASFCPKYYKGRDEKN